VHRRSPRRILATALATAALIAVTAAPAVGAPPTGTSKGITIVAQGLTGLGSFTISGGQVIPIQITVTNEGKSVVNDVNLAVGKDNSPTTAANGDSTPPINLPSAVTLSAVGCDGGTLLTCEIGTLRARGGSATFDITVTTAEVAEALANIMTKATVTASEGGNDNGSNLDTFSIEGTLSVTPFSCESVTVYKPGADKTATTCAVDDARNANHQSALVILPSGLSVATVKENAGAACPFTTCLGDEVEADIDGDSTANTVKWTVTIDLTAAGVSVPNPQKIVAWHKGDNLSDPVQTFELSKKNACKTDAQQLCGAASIEIVDGHEILTITIQTGGNGKSRFT
jgi:hypothetical protein